jgi:DNA-nicking Smr family endonuclease
MARKKPRKPQSHQQRPRDERFHTPFNELKALLREVGSAPPPPTPPSKSASKPTRQALPDLLAQQDQALFLAEMAGVKPLRPDRRGRVEKPRQPSRETRKRADARGALADLRELVAGRGTFHIQYTDEYMEGVAPGIDRRLAQRLHHGDFSVQAHLDLHGCTVDEAKSAVDDFLTNAYASGRRCVRLVHGRGHNSRDHRPVLKEQVQLWLSHGRLSRLILAFATAPSTDGGAGAVYVLLRRGPSAPQKKEAH